MNNFVISFKRFIKNKNTVTIIGVVAVLMILYFGYRYQINKATSPVTGIPVAAVTIQPRTKITTDMVDTVSVAPILLQSNVYRTKAQVIDKYSNVNTVIPQGSMFYKDTLISESELPDAALIKLESGQVPYNFPVNMAMTYYNSIYPDNYIDIYMKAVNENGTLMVGKLIENVKVLAVKDSQGRHVFENSEETRTPAVLIFGVSDELNILLRKASYMSSFSVVLFPVPHGVNGAAEVTGATAVSSQTLKDFINANTVPNDELVTPEGE
ncbi:MAG: SAF domain-containing protein [Tenericutes bacterium]|nr:SAF domain-containing protein [Mycoplasmatota bacterium]